MMSAFADRRSYVLEGKPVDQQDHLGFDLASTQQAAVPAGNSGKAVTLACENYVMSLEAIENLIGFKLPMAHVEDEMLVRPKPSQRRHHAPHDNRHPPREARHDDKSNDQRRRGRRRRGGAARASSAQTTG